MLMHTQPRLSKCLNQAGELRRDSKFLRGGLPEQTQKNENYLKVGCPQHM